LCEQALGVIATVPDLEVALVDIAEDDNLMERYGIRIPVLYCPINAKEIGWPFDREGLLIWLSGFS